MECHERYTGPIVPGIRFRVEDGTEYAVGLFDPGARYAVCWDQGGADTEEHFRMERRVTHVPPEVLADGWVRLRKVGVNHLQGDEAWYCMHKSCNALAVYGVRVGGRGACEAHARSQGAFRKEGLPDPRTVVKDIYSPYTPIDFKKDLQGEFDRMVGQEPPRPRTVAPGWVATSSNTHLCQSKGCGRRIDYATNDGRMLWSCSTHAAGFGVFGVLSGGKRETMELEVVKERGHTFAPGWKSVEGEVRGKFYICTLPDGNVRHGAGCSGSGWAAYINRDAKGFPGACEAHAAENGVFRIANIDLKITNVFAPGPFEDPRMIQGTVSTPPVRPCPCTRSLPDLCWVHVPPKKRPRPPVSRATIVGRYEDRGDRIPWSVKREWERAQAPTGQTGTRIASERLAPTLTELACAQVWKGYRN